MNHDAANIVAIVDDDDDVGDVLRGLLETMGYHVESYRSGPDFLTNAQLERVGCLVIDQNMPHMTGIDILRQLNERGILIPSLLITGTVDPHVADQASKLGVMSVLEKPMSHRELLRFVSFSVG